MGAEQNKKSRRIPLSSEELATVIAFKKRKERHTLLKLKGSLSYKLLNIFNTVCFFIFCELVFCYLGPCSYQTHYSKDVTGVLGQELKGNGTPIVAEVEITCVEDHRYKFVINDYISMPSDFCVFEIGKDFILRKDIKGSFEGNEKTYRIFAASPVLFLSVFTSIIMILAVGNNLNENEYSLAGITIVNAMTLLCVVFI